MLPFQFYCLYYTQKINRIFLRLIFCVINFLFTQEQIDELRLNPYGKTNPQDIQPSVSPSPNFTVFSCENTNVPNTSAFSESSSNSQCSISSAEINSDSPFQKKLQAPYFFTFYQIKFVTASGSVSGSPNCSFPSAMLFIRNTMFLARVRIVWRPSSSISASPFSIP